MSRDERTLASVNLRLGFTTVSNAFAAAYVFDREWSILQWIATDRRAT